MTTEPLNLSELDEVYRQQRLNRIPRWAGIGMMTMASPNRSGSPAWADTQPQRAGYLPRGCDQQGRQPQAAEACTEVGADAPRNDASLWREWCDFIESLLPPGVRIGSMLRGLFWIAVAVCFVGAGIALAVSALPSIGT